jgi:cytidylate kinase
MHKPTELDQMIERQVSTWDSQERLREQTGKRVRSDSHPHGGGPWVTVSLQLGSGGVDLAAAVAARLGWQLFNKEFLHAIASRMHVRERVLSRLDGHAIGALQDYLDHLFVPGHPGRPAYLREMLAVLWSIAREGQAVIVGRGANWLLDPGDGLRVRVIAPASMRVEWLLRAETLTPAEAQRRIKEDDADRAAFVRQTFNKDIDDALGYDVIINRGTLEHAAAVDSVLAALERKLEHRSELRRAL